MCAVKNNLYNARKFRGLTQKELAEKAGVKVSSYRKWEQCVNNPKMDDMVRLCRVLGLPLDTIAYPNSPMPELDTAWVDVPLYGTIAAGEAIEMIEVDNHHAIPVSVHKRYPKAFLLEVKGESMNKVLPNGSYALIEPCSDVDRDGKPYAVCVNGYDATIKRVRRLENGFELVPDSTDPTFHAEVFDYSVEGTKTITIIGRVVWYAIPYDCSL